MTDEAEPEAEPEAHSHYYGEWFVTEEHVGWRLWERDCLHEHCRNRQVTSANPFEPTALDRALGGLAGIDFD